MAIVERVFFVIVKGVFIIGGMGFFRNDYDVLVVVVVVFVGVNDFFFVRVVVGCIV